ncbi:hypothetical protein [Streptomyces sp. 7N604]|uniref:hypothetical protein n=1 Tax=Streptomyces sp. 7N604 TaxID=3457415 RepID=UPI003FD57FE4
MVSLIGKGKGRAAGGLGCMPVASVVLDAADEERQPAREGEHFTMLREREALRVEFNHSLQPLPTLDKELFARHVRVLRAKAIRRDPQRVEGRIVHVGPVEAADDFVAFPCRSRQGV